MTKTAVVRASVGAGLAALLLGAVAVGPALGLAADRETGTVKLAADRENGTVKLAKAAGDKKVEVIK
ncbi:hypothetical protein HPO96_33825 [Kribbella sandramycini]|uniref:Uncharacterized protein n=1 Tax=Kribbella sandramycini TaxID=60450 RepID=A0A7Y4L6F9_9ACTN|nr:hypothetical protein [Kribbella sandramycini]MBB6570377.1 hypothetical protein [Kribbella sandramycini]NOL45239.1 hypothetical protein [Kribbella sandramycini]